MIAQKYYEKACALGEYSNCQKPEVVIQNKQDPVKICKKGSQMMM